MENQQKIGLIFEGDVNIALHERERVESELRKLGNVLSFKVLKNEDGWMAQCAEVEGIIAGGLNPNPSDSEIRSQIRESIYAAFSVETQESPVPSFGLQQKAVFAFA